MTYGQFISASNAGKHYSNTDGVMRGVYRKKFESASCKNVGHSPYDMHLLTSIIKIALLMMKIWCEKYSAHPRNCSMMIVTLHPEKKIMW